MKDHRLVALMPRMRAGSFVGASVLAIGCMLSIVGCGHAPIRTAAVTQFSQGVAQTRQQAQLAFHDANALAREEQVQYVLATTRPGIVEKDFTPALDPDAVSAWDSAFGAMQSYTSALGQLLSPDQAAQFASATEGLATELKNGKVGAEISPGVATAFTQVGEALITLKAQSDAQAAMQKADPGIRAALKAMADAIGDSNKHGVRGTVWSNWEAKLREGPGHSYSEAVRNNNNQDQKRAAVTSFLAMLDQRDAQLSSLAALRQSLLLLADAHTAAANGSAADAAGIISLISQQLDETKSLFQKFTAIEGDNSTKPKSTPKATSAGGSTHGG